MQDVRLRRLVRQVRAWGTSRHPPFVNEWLGAYGAPSQPDAAEVISRRVRLAHFPLLCARCGTLVSLGRGAISLPPNDAATAVTR